VEQAFTVSSKRWMDGCVIDCVTAYGMTMTGRSRRVCSTAVLQVKEPRKRVGEPERKRKNLIRLGVEQGDAYAWND